MNRSMPSIAASYVFRPSKPRLPLINGAWNSWYPQVKIRLLTPKEIDRYDPDGLAFFNVNTLEDFAQAEQRARE